MDHIRAGMDRLDIILERCLRNPPIGLENICIPYGEEIQRMIEVLKNSSKFKELSYVNQRFVKEVLVAKLLIEDILGNARYAINPQYKNLGTEIAKKYNPHYTEKEE